MQQNPKTTEELLKAALVAEATVVDSSSALNNASRLRSKRHHQHRPAPRSSTSPSRFPRSPASSRDRRQVLFKDQRRPPFNDTRQPFRRVEQRQWTAPPLQWRAQPRTPTDQPFARPQACGRMHAVDACFAYGKTCRNCGKLNHFTVVCRSAPRSE